MSMLPLLSFIVGSPKFPQPEDPVPKGGRGYLMSSPRLESQGCHLIPLYYLLSSSSAEPRCSFCLVLSLLLVHSHALIFSVSSFKFSLRNRLFCVALV